MKECEEKNAVEINASAPTQIRELPADFLLIITVCHSHDVKFIYFCCCLICILSNPSMYLLVLVSLSMFIKVLGSSKRLGLHFSFYLIKCDTIQNVLCSIHNVYRIQLCAVCCIATNDIQKLHTKHNAFAPKKS